MLRYTLIGSFSIQMLTILPLFVGAMTTSMELNELQAGLMGSADLAGAGLACLLVFLFSDRVQWHKGLGGVALIAVIFNLICLDQTNYNLLLLLRFCSGFTAGILYAATMVAIGRSKAPERYFGICMAGQALIATPTLALAPGYIATYGPDAIYWLVALFMLICLVFAIGIEAIPRIATDEFKHEGGKPSTSLIGTMALYVGQGGLWAFAERIGDTAAIGPEQIGYAMAIAAPIGIAGGIAAAWQGNRHGFKLPLLLVFAGETLALLLLWLDLGWIGYTVALSIYNFFWTYVVPYHLAIISMQDGNRRLVALAPAFQGLGLAAGPVLCGLILQMTQGFSVFYISIISMAFISLMLMRHSLSPATITIETE